jgi:hypothetical protein
MSPYYTKKEENCRISRLKGTPGIEGKMGILLSLSQPIFVGFALGTRILSVHAASLNKR